MITIKGETSAGWMVKIPFYLLECFEPKKAREQRVITQFIT